MHTLQVLGSPFRGGAKRGPRAGGGPGPTASEWASTSEPSYSKPTASAPEGEAAGDFAAPPAFLTTSLRGAWHTVGAQ